MLSSESEDGSERFGRVFLQSRGKEDEQHQLKPIHAACFSNLDWRWYDACGDIHPKYKTYEERNFSIGCKLNNLNLEDNDNKSFEVRLRLPLKLGAAGTPHNMELLREAQKMERELATKLDFISAAEDDPAGKFFKEASTASLLIFMTPGKELIRENNFLLHLIPFIYFNEIIESNQTSAVAQLRNKVPYKALSVIPKAIINILNGTVSASITFPMELVQLARSGNVSISGMLELRRIYKSLLNLNRNIYVEALKLGTYSEAQPLFQVLMDYSETIFLQMSQEWGEMNSSLRSVKENLRAVVGPTILASEAIALQCGVRLSDDIRSSIIFKQFLHEIATHTSKVHDMMSYGKDVEMTSSSEQGNSSSYQNEVYYLHKVCNWSLERALQNVMEHANKSMIRIEEIGNLLLRLYDDESLADYIKIVNDVILGYIQWLGFTQFYHSNLTYDCYVEDE